MNTFQELTNIELVKTRSRAFQKARSFFYTKNYFETDCPILSPFAALDNHIDLFTTTTPIPYFLHSSPEYGMKKLLSKGSPSIFQLSHVFRMNESGSKHMQEFTMLEFYKLDISFENFISETCELIELFTKKKDKQFFTYKKAFLTYLNLDPFQDIELIKTKLEISLDDLTDDDILSVAMSTLIEPCFDKDALVIVTDFPASQAALADSFTDEDGNEVAKRFEIYHQNLELANGYKELSCHLELKKRFNRLNALRISQNKSPYPIDQELLDAMGSYFPDCCGVACGFDRLLMLELRCHDIKNTQSILGI